MRLFSYVSCRQSGQPFLYVACICRRPAGRLLCAAGNAVDARNPWWEKNNASNMISIRSVDEFIAELVRRMQTANFFCLTNCGNGYVCCLPL